MKSKLAPAPYHQSSKTDYRNIAIPKDLHRALSHIALDHDTSTSAIVGRLILEFRELNHDVKPDEELKWCQGCAQSGNPTRTDL